MVRLAPPAATRKSQERLDIGDGLVCLSLPQTGADGAHNGRVPWAKDEGDVRPAMLMRGDSRVDLGGQTGTNGGEPGEPGEGLGHDAPLGE